MKLSSNFVNYRSIDSSKDYRYDMEKDQSDINRTYLSPTDHNSDIRIKKILSLLTSMTHPVFQEQIVEPVKGRTITVPRSCNHVCVYYFNELMESVMGDTDFRAICKNFKAIIIRNMREIKRHEANIANRLIKLFDEAYFRNVKIYIEATVSLEDIIKPIP